jgi:hypothetical protein
MALNKEIVARMSQSSSFIHMPVVKVVVLLSFEGNPY